MLCFIYRVEEADQAVKLDAFHYLDRIFRAVRSSSPLFRYFKELITAAVFVDNKDDIELQILTLQERGMSREDAERVRPGYFRNRMTCRRHIPMVFT